MNNTNDGLEKYMETLEELIDTAFGQAFRKKGKEAPSTPKNAKYQSIQEYTEQTGKRFRVTKNQKERNLSRDEAFQEFLHTLSDES
tara:strand:- start:733 stop:990 length:258 start_codon:yes stop_codon:yes gene_type:complete